MDMLKLRSLRFPVGSVPIFLLGISLLAYGIFIPWYGVFGDDWIYLWNYHLFGANSFSAFVANDRPYSAWIYSLLTYALGEKVWAYHVFFLVLRWLTSVLMWVILRLLMRERRQMQVCVALLFLVYPGFKQQPIPLEFILHFVVLALFLLSLVLMILALQNRRWFWLLTTASMVCSCSFFSSEYFLGLELMRPALIWIVLRARDSDLAPECQQKRKLRADLEWVLKFWLPYGLVLGAFLLWRVLIFKFQFYQPKLLENLAAAPFSALVKLLITVLSSIKEVLVSAWLQTFTLSTPGGVTHYLLVLAIILLTWGYISFLLPGTHPQKAMAGAKFVPGLVFGGMSLLAAGFPFWMVGIPVEVVFPWDRSTLPFMIGVSLVIYSLIAMVIREKYQPAVIAVLVGLAVGIQFQNALVFKLENENLKQFFWQLTWRAPGLKPGTILVSDKLPLVRESDNDLTPLLNWTYAPQLDSNQMPYLFIDLESRDDAGLPGYRTELKVEHRLRTMIFEGSTSNLLVVDYSPPNCLHVLSGLDIKQMNLPDRLQRASSLSNLDQIEASANPPVQPPQALFPEPPRDWCYFFQKGELAAQQKDWQRVVAIGDQTLKVVNPHITTENLPFIEGYAHMKRWDEAKTLTYDAKYDQANAPLLCATWKRIAKDMAAELDSMDQIKIIQDKAGCL
jgi:hypothetical protein